MDEIMEKVYSYIDSHCDSAIQFLQRLIRHKTFAGYERYAQMDIAEFLNDLGCTVDIWDPSVRDLKKYPSFSTAREHFNGSPNVVGVLPGTGEGKSLILNSHIDVVPAGMTGWSYDPWQGEISQGRLYGRGASDMKGGSVALLLALGALHDAGVRLKGDLIFQSVIDEAISGAGTLACIDRGYRGDAAIIPAPTDLSICTVSTGCLWFRIVIHGQAAHGAMKAVGVNALDRALEIIRLLNDLDRERTNCFLDGTSGHNSLSCNINIGRISSGTWPASIPDEAVIEGRVGLKPDETADVFKNEFVRFICNETAKDPWMRDHPPVIQWLNVFEQYNRIPEDHPIVEELSWNYKQVTSCKPRFYEATWGNDASALVNYAQVPTILFGPGHRNAVYKTDEYIEIDNIFVAARIFASTIIDWCEAL